MRSKPLFSLLSLSFINSILAIPQLAPTATITQSAGSVPTIETLPGCTIAPSDKQLLDSLPRPPTKLRSDLATITNFCSPPTLKDGEAGDYSTYMASVSSWYSANSASLSAFESSYASACPAASSAVSGASKICTPTSSSHKDAKSTSSKGAAAAPEQTKMAFMGGLAAGLAGVMAVL